MRRPTSKLKGTPRPVAGKPVVASAAQTTKMKRPPRPRPVAKKRPNKKLKGTPRPVAGRPSR